MAAHTNDTDKGQKRITRELAKLHNSFSTVGVHKNAGKYSGAGTQPTVAQVAAWNEFGTVNAPARPYMRSAIDVNRSRLILRNAKEFGRVLDGTSTARHALDRLGFYVQTIIQARIQTAVQWAEPNAPSTRAGKRNAARGGASPLIETMLLHNSITHKTTMRGKV